MLYFLVLCLNECLVGLCRGQWVWAFLEWVRALLICSLEALSLCISWVKRLDHVSYQLLIGWGLLLLMSLHSVKILLPSKCELRLKTLVNDLRPVKATVVLLWKLLPLLLLYEWLKCCLLRPVPLSLCGVFPWVRFGVKYFTLLYLHLW
jgi:hypothetical protein